MQVYVTQPVIKSGCVLRRANVGILEKENLVERKDVVSLQQTRVSSSLHLTLISRICARTE